jgi:hypothetical protein
MADFNWTENSQAVFEAALSAAPLPFKAVSKRNLTKGLVALVGEGGDVREVDVVKAIRLNSPAPFIDMGMKAIKPVLTDPTILEHES